MTKKNPHWGTTLDEFLGAEGVRETGRGGYAPDRQAAHPGMERQGISKAALAEKMHTSRGQVDRILKAKGNTTIDTLQRAAALVGRELRRELI